ncbi:hypothetical protein BDV98DRAFT_579425 [Pterulicium gracile]|uniref:Uncharacterized protein n=1 Tax=Pterulicium gracile TaxID=1884261 RepID=A0A5C3QYL5_9AGAR|nr:hypothetical protein BDV98DRAFT_579425 [Pterula gracilis]
MLALNLWTLRRNDLPWEVVESVGVDPIPVCYEENGPSDISRTYVFRLQNYRTREQLKGAVRFARNQLVEEVQRGETGFDSIIHERWVIRTAAKQFADELKGSSSWQHETDCGLSSRSGRNNTV